MKYQRIFTANEGDPSVDNAGPDAIEQDLDNLYINSKELSDRADGLQSSVDNIVAGGTIPLDHSSAQTIYGLGTTAKHGHVKVIDALTSSEYADGEVLSARQGKVLYDGKAPSNHAKNDDTYGLGTETNYGHIALANNLSVANYQHGLALSANQGKVLNDNINNKIQKTLIRTINVTSSGSYSIPDDLLPYDFITFELTGNVNYRNDHVNQSYIDINLSNANYVTILSKLALLNAIGGSNYLTPVIINNINIKRVFPSIRLLDVNMEGNIADYKLFQSQNSRSSSDTLQTPIQFNVLKTEKLIINSMSLALKVYGLNFN